MLEDSTTQYINDNIQIKMNTQWQKMYFPFYIPYTYMLPTFPFNNYQTPLSIVQPIVQSSRNFSPQRNISQDEIIPQIEGKKNSNFINITIEDLKQAGYTVVKKVWTEQQDQRLKELVKIHGTQWEVIQKLIPHRNKKMCYSRYKRLQCSPKHLWKKADNQKLQQLVERFKDDWQTISNYFKHRSPKQIKEHYQNYLRPQIVLNQWNLAEDVKLINLLNKYGTQWKKIQLQMPQRGQNQLKNRYFGRFRRIIEKKSLNKGKPKNSQTNTKID